MKNWIQPVLLLGAGLALGLLLHYPHQPNRFVWDANGNVLDTKTGQACAPINDATVKLPICLDVYKHY